MNWLIEFHRTPVMGLLLCPLQHEDRLDFFSFPLSQLINFAIQLAHDNWLEIAVSTIPLCTFYSGPPCTDWKSKLKIF